MKKIIKMMRSGVVPPAKYPSKSLKSSDQTAYQEVHTVQGKGSANKIA